MSDPRMFEFPELADLWVSIPPQEDETKSVDMYCPLCGFGGNIFRLFVYDRLLKTRICFACHRYIYEDPDILLDSENPRTAKITMHGLNPEQLRRFVLCSLSSMRIHPWRDIHLQVITGRDGKEFIRFKRKRFGPYEWILDRCLSPNCKRWAAVVTKEGKQFLLLDGIEIEWSAGSIDHLCFNPDSDIFLSFHNVSKASQHFIFINGQKELGPFNPSFWPLDGSLKFSNAGSHWACAAKEKKMHFLLVNGQRFGPFSCQDLICTFSPNGERWATTIRRRNHEYLFIDGQEYGPFDLYPAQDGIEGYFFKANYVFFHPRTLCAVGLVTLNRKSYAFHEGELVGPFEEVSLRFVDERTEIHFRLHPGKNIESISMS